MSELRSPSRTLPDASRPRRERDVVPSRRDSATGTPQPRRRSSDASARRTGRSAARCTRRSATKTLARHRRRVPGCTEKWRCMPFARAYDRRPWRASRGVRRLAGPRRWRRGRPDSRQRTSWNSGPPPGRGADGSTRRSHGTLVGGAPDADVGAGTGGRRQQNAWRSLRSRAVGDLRGARWSSTGRATPSGGLDDVLYQGARRRREGQPRRRRARWSRCAPRSAAAICRLRRRGRLVGRHRAERALPPDAMDRVFGRDGIAGSPAAPECVDRASRGLAALMPRWSIA